MGIFFRGPIAFQPGAGLYGEMFGTDRVNRPGVFGKMSGQVAYARSTKKIAYGVEGSEKRPVALVRGPLNTRMKNRFYPVKFLKTKWKKGC